MKWYRLKPFILNLKDGSHCGCHVSRQRALIGRTLSLPPQHAPGLYLVTISVDLMAGDVFEYLGSGSRDFVS